MPAEVTQANRLLSISTPLGEDVLLINSVVISERVSGLFAISLDLLANAPSAGGISGDALVGQEVSIRLSMPNNQERYFHGIVCRFSEGNKDERFAAYKAEVVPWFWLMTLTADCRIFQDKTVPDIIEEVFKESGFQNFRNTLTKQYTKWDYCVQYRETDFDFLSRLMEEEGIFYYFEHEERKHTLVLADSPEAFKPCPGQEKARYVPEIGFGENEDVALSWQKSQLLRPGKYALRDFHFETPAKTYDVNEPTLHPIAGNTKYEMFDYPGYYAQKFCRRGPAEVDQEAHNVVRVRMEEQESPHEIYEGTTYCRGLRAGFRFELTGHRKLSGQYSITAVQHTAVQSPAYVSDLQVEPAYSNSVTCIPFGSKFRPARVTAQPIVQGPQTAIVVGPSGEEIWTDKFSRVKVQFHWDRLGKNNDQSSCWVRVAQPWAGSKWGAIFIPRIGQEVVVDFLEGDPDQPIIVGSVYNNAQMPPYELPANQTQSGIKTRSSKGGGSSNFNELRFEDKKGSEDVYFHAEKDFHRVVENDDDLQVGDNQTIVIQNDRTENVKKGNETITIEKGNRDTTIKMGNETLTISMGNQTTKISLGKSETEAMQSIELKVGQSSVKLDQMGVTIKGMMISIEGQVQVDVKGVMTNINGTALVNIKGGITMIN